MSKDVIFEQLSNGDLRPVIVERTATGFTRLENTSRTFTPTQEILDYTSGTDSHVENAGKSEAFKAGYEDGQHLV